MKRIWTFILITFLSACTLVPNEYAEQSEEIEQGELKNDDLIGAYTLDSASKTWIKREGLFEISTHTLKLNKDSTYETNNMPVWDWKGKFQNLINKNGKWSFGTHHRYIGYYVYLLEHNDPTLRIKKRKGKLILIEVYGDPDSGTAMVYEKNN